MFLGLTLTILTDTIYGQNCVFLHNHEKATKKLDDFQPEWRLPPGKLANKLFRCQGSKKSMADFDGIAILGGPLVTIGLFIFAWTIYPNVHWIAPIIGSAVFGAG